MLPGRCPRASTPTVPCEKMRSPTIWRAGRCFRSADLKHLRMPYGRARGADHGWQPWAGPGDGRNVSQGRGESRHCRATPRCAAGGLPAVGPIDILVHNAGTSVRGSFLEHTDDAWQADFDRKVQVANRYKREQSPCPSKPRSPPSARAFPSAAWARRRNTRIWRASWLPMPAPL
jgi:hypothetical protein